MPPLMKVLSGRTKRPVLEDVPVRYVHATCTRGVRDRADGAYARGGAYSHTDVRVGKYVHVSHDIRGTYVCPKA